jgi:hypothetical protein
VALPGAAAALNDKADACNNFLTFLKGASQISCRSANVLLLREIPRRAAFVSELVLRGWSAIMVPKDYMQTEASKVSQAGEALPPVLLYSLPLALAACWSLPLLLTPSQALSFLTEDGFFENLGAFLFFSAGVLFLATWVHCRKHAYAAGLLFLGLLMVFIAGEEISWGQRILGWSTPATYENVQNETTIHNHPLFDKSTAGLLSMNNLFEYFNIGYGFVVPFLATLIASIGLVMRRWGISLVPLAIGVAFPANYVLSKLYRFIVDDEWIHRIAELRESAQALVWFAVACAFFAKRRYLL